MFNLLQKLAPACFINGRALIIVAFKVFLQNGSELFLPDLEFRILRTEFRNQGIFKTYLFQLRAPVHSDHVPDVLIIK